MKSEQLSAKDSRPTIGLLIHDVTGASDYESAILNGISDVVQARDVNLICFPGGVLSPSSEVINQRNITYDLVDATNVDGLLISGTLSNFIAPEDFRKFYERYLPMPIVGIASTMEGIPSVLVDNYGGMRNAIVHLTQVHQYRRIAFIRGPENNEEAEERYRAYTDILTEYGIPIDQNLVVTGDFEIKSGAQAVRILIDKRKMEFEALVAANDNMALGALKALQRRGINIPHDIVVVGFDNLAKSEASIPPLTTVQQPLYEVGRRAAHALLSLLAGAEVSEQVIVPTRLIERQSCGCLSSATVQAAAEVRPKGESDVPEPFSEIFGRQREDILFEIVQAMNLASSLVTTERVEQLLDAFSAELIDGRSGIFLSELDQILRLTITEGNDVTSWQNALSALRRYVLPHLLQGDEVLFQAEDLWQQARVMVGEASQRALAQEMLRNEQQTQTLNEVVQGLIATFNMDTLKETLVRDLPRLGIPSFHLAFYKGTGTNIEESELLLAYDEQSRVGPVSEEQTFPSRQLIPPNLPSHQGLFERRHTLVVEPLNFERPLGFAVLETGPKNWAIYAALRDHLSNALRGALLVREVKDRTQSLQEANYALQRRAIQLEASAEVARAITSIFDVDELLRKAVNLIRDRFGFYHAGIFLLDEPGEWAVLQEATGKAGAQMKAQNHRLAVGETSMVGWTALHRQPRIALYADEDAVRFANPLLPYTRSEMTLPMMIGDRLLGVLNVQSTEEAAFDEDDIRALQSMANQIAIAIENAQRVSEEALLLEAASPIYRVSRELAQVTTISEVADTIIQSVAEMGADGCTVVEFEFAPNGVPEALLYRGVWRRDRETRYRPGMRLPISESPFPLDMVSSLWTVANVEQDKQLPESARQVFTETGVKALANIPLHVRDKIIGQVVVLRSVPGPFSNSAMRLYEALSDQAAVALERAQLWEEAQKRAEYEQAARQMIDRIRRALDVEQALQTAAKELSQAVDVPYVSIELNLDQTN